MLVNRNCDMNSHIKFVNYTGKYPNLCGGILTLEIDRIEYTFGDVWKSFKTDFNRFWGSGGNVIANDDGDFDVEYGEWVIDVSKLPEQFRKYAQEIDEAFNENVEHGCCGGCI